MLEHTTLSIYTVFLKCTVRIECNHELCSICIEHTHKVLCIIMFIECTPEVYCIIFMCRECTTTVSVLEWK